METAAKPRSASKRPLFKRTRDECCPVAFLQDSALYREIFGWNVTRSEVLLVAAADGRTNLLQKPFLDRLWILHAQIMDLRVTADDVAGDALASAAAAKLPEGSEQAASGRPVQTPETLVSGQSAR